MRTLTNINADWAFSLKARAVPEVFPDSWEKIDLPFTWNGTDGQDGGNDYYRGKGFFAKRLTKEQLALNEERYIEFQGVNSTAEVYFNGKKLAGHRGGYSIFRVKIDTEDIRDENLLVVTADNSHNEAVYPQTADFTFYGGIYRDVNIISVNVEHFDLCRYGAQGITATPKIEGANAVVKAKAFCCGKVKFEISDGERVIAESYAEGENPASCMEIKNVRLWNGKKDPYLYILKAFLISDGEIKDEISIRFGCRTFKIDPERGFFLNGKEYPLRGVSRHQDRPKIGNALLRKHHEEDIAIILESGANTVRLAHYQHSQVFYDLCDEKGLIVWAEIPYISKHAPQAAENTKTQLTELIMQNYNHPSIAVWGLSNEPTLGGSDNKALAANHRALYSLAHSLDKTRLTAAAVVSMCPPENEYTQIPDLIAYNHYFGWYGGETDMYGKWFDAFHKKYPARAIGLSEYGCEALNWHTSNPEQGDYTEEYQAYYHEELIKQLSVRPYIWASYVWNMFDFASDARDEGGESGINHKGLVSFDRKYKKDAFYAYKAWLSDEATLHICSKRYVDRTQDVTEIRVYSNQPEIELFVNGKSVGKQKKGRFPFFYFNIKNEGESLITAKAGSLTDEAKIKKVDKFNKAYRMSESAAVINWFEIDSPAGRFSINDRIGDIFSTPRGKLFMLRVILKYKNIAIGKKGSDSSGMSFAGFKINKTLIETAFGFTLKRALMMLGNKFTKEQILEINSGLNKIKKPVKKQ